MDPTLHADLGGAVLDRLGDARLKFILGHVVGVRRALALPEPAERAADDADVRKVDVAVDDERHPLPRQLLPQLVGGGPHVLDDLRPRLREERRQLALSERVPPAPLFDRPEDLVGVDCPLCTAPRPIPRDEAPVLQLHHVEHSLLHPLRIQVLRVSA